MKANFKIDNNSAVLYNGQIIDLHNNFDFVGMTEDVQHKEVKLHFVKSEGNWVKADEFAQLTFSLKNITYKYVEEGEPESYPNDAKCLGEITFFPSEYRDINDSIMQQSEPRENDDLMFFFEDGQVIRVHCEEAELIVNQ